jgi:hypothetical protein
MSDVMRRPGKVDLTLGTLVLEEVPRHHRHRVAAALERELARLLAERGVPGVLQRSGVVPRLQAGEMKTTPADSASELGRRIAHSLHGGLGS